MPAQRPRATIGTLIILLSSLMGCSGPAPVSPLDSRTATSPRLAGAEASGFGSATFYPLSVGNSWSYSGSGVLRYVRDGVPTEPVVAYSFTETHRLIGTTTHEGTRYVVEEQIHVDPDSYYGTATWWQRFRQDATGLLGLDSLLREPPVLDAGRAHTPVAGSRTDHPLRVDLARRYPGGGATLERLEKRLEVLRELAHGITHTPRTPGEGSTPAGVEVTLLVYPLRPGISWSIRPDFLWPARVDRIESLDTPLGQMTAYRIEINPGGSVVQEGEWVRVWYSRHGYLGSSIHLSEEQTNDQGEPTGTTLVFDDTMVVTSMSLAR